MIKIENNIAQFEGDPKDICLELTYLLMGFSETLEKEYQLSHEEAICVIAECANIAVMNEDDRKKYLDSYSSWNEVLN